MLAVFILAGFGTFDRGSFGPFIRSLNTTSYGYRVIKDPTHGAPTSMVERFEVRPGDCGQNTGQNFGWNDCATDRERSELSEKGNRNPAGSTYWYGWSLYFPKAYKNVYPTKVALGQFQQENSHPVWMFQNSSGGYHLNMQVFGFSSRDTELIADNELRGQWHRVEVQAKWSRKDDGFFRVWVDGEQKVAYSGKTMSVSTVYFKYGIYRSFVSRYKTAKGVGKVPTQVVYYANVRRAVSREGLSAPSQ